MADWIIKITIIAEKVFSSLQLETHKPQVKWVPQYIVASQACVKILRDVIYSLSVPAVYITDIKGNLADKNGWWRILRMLQHDLFVKVSEIVGPHRASQMNHHDHYPVSLVCSIILIIKFTAMSDATCCSILLYIYFNMKLHNLSSYSTPWFLGINCVP